MAKMTTELKALVKASNKAWNVMANGSEADACTIRGLEGANYLAWCAAADAERAYREAQEVVEVSPSRQLWATAA